MENKVAQKAGNKIRLDALVCQLYPQYSRQQVQSWIMQGKILVDDKIVAKSGTQVKQDAKIVITASDPKYVGRAGFKLEGALQNFEIDVKDLVALDAGLSTGGFTDCMLQAGVKKVYGIDVGHAQVHEKIRQDSRVVVAEHLNLRHTQEVLALLNGEKVDIVTLDLSFISVLKVMETVIAVLKPQGKLVVLIKPQFEAEHHEIGKGGIVKDENVHKKIVEKITSGICDNGFELIGTMLSPIEGATGNKEFLAYFKKT